MEQQYTTYKVTLIVDVLEGNTNPLMWDWPSIDEGIVSVSCEQLPTEE